VLTAGGVQALVKGHGVRPGHRVVVAGSGPFLLPVAETVLRAGATVPAVLEAGSPLALAADARALIGAAGKLLEAGRYAARLARTRTPYRRRHAVVAVLGDRAVEAVRVARLDAAGRIVSGTETIIECDVLAVGWGFTPQVELALQLGCATDVGADGSLVVGVDAAQRTSVPGVWAAGEITGIGGVELALVEGEIAGRAATGAAPTAGQNRRRHNARRFAAALHAAQRIPQFLLADLPASTLVCRCEEVPFGAVREAVQEWSATDARTVKLLARPGMGWCQGRVCGHAVAVLTARLLDRPVSPADLRAFAERPIAVPVPLGRLADDPAGASGGTVAVTPDRVTEPPDDGPETDARDD
jgi:hypothetical protein